MYFRRLVAAAMVIATCAGCGATAPPSASPLPLAANPPGQLASPAASPTPSALVLTQDQIRSAAGAAYLGVVNKGNKARTALAKQYKNATSFASGRQFCTKAASIAHAELAGLKAITYPTDTAVDAKALIRNDASQEADLRSCAKSTTLASQGHELGLAQKAADRAHEAANLVRLDLNLPAVPG